MWKLLIVFTVMPVLEMIIFYQLGTRVGLLPTVGLILITGVLGAWLAKREGLSVLGQIRDGLRRGLPPAGPIAEAGLVVAGGLLLITPGTLTDLMGFTLIFPPTRRLLAPFVLSWVLTRVTVRMNGRNRVRDGGSPQQPPSASGLPRSGSSEDDPFDHPIV